MRQEAKAEANGKGIEMTQNEIREELSESNEQMLFMDGYDDCLIGVVERFGMPTVAAYDYEKVIGRHIRDGMTRNEAEEYFEFNQIGAWMGDNTPAFVKLR